MTTLKTLGLRPAAGVDYKAGFQVLRALVEGVTFRVFDPKRSDLHNRQVALPWIVNGGFDEVFVHFDDLTNIEIFKVPDLKSVSKLFSPPAAVETTEVKSTEVVPAVTRKEFDNIRASVDSLIRGQFEVLEKLDMLLDVTSYGRYEDEGSDIPVFAGTDEDGGPAQD